MHNAKLVLEDGTEFLGYAFGSTEKKVGEVIIQTGMTGYQEVLSDPAHANHIVVMSYPLIGNYGLNHDDFESIEPAVRGLVVREKCDLPSNFRSTESMDEYTHANDIPAIEGIDTRKLSRHIRNNGSMKGVIVPTSTTTEEAQTHIASATNGTNAVQETSTVKPYVVPGRGKRIVLIDLGLKHGILRSLTNRNCHVTVVPFNYSVEDIVRLQPDGIIVSNGPGKIRDIESVTTAVKALIHQIPLLGIGLGHLVLASACGARIKDTSSGRYVTGLPVTHEKTKITRFTSMHQSEEIIEESLENLPLEVIERIADDGSIVSVHHTNYKAFSVQYNPESAPGPEETSYVFDHFLSYCSAKHIS